MFTHFYDNISFDLNGIFLLQPGSSSELTLMWRRLADLQYAMSWPQSTVVQGAVYITEKEQNIVVIYADMTHKHNSGPNYHYANTAGLL